MSNPTAPHLPVTLSKQEQAFSARLGARIAHLRKEQGTYPGAVRRGTGCLAADHHRLRSREKAYPGVDLSGHRQGLGVTVEALVAEATKPAKRGPASKRQQQLERISQVPKTRQRFVIDAR